MQGQEKKILEEFGVKSGMLLNVETKLYMNVRSQSAK